MLVELHGEAPPPSSYVSKAPPPLYHILFLRNLLCITLNVFPEYNQKDPPRPSKECKGNAAHQFKNYYDFTLNGTIGLWRDFSISEHGFLECLFHSPNLRSPALDG